MVLIFTFLQACGGGDETEAPKVTTPIVTPPETVVPISPTPNDPISIFGPSHFLKIVDGQNGLSANIDGGDRFGRDHDQAGDIDGDGVVDLVIGARSDDDGATDAGAAYILFMNPDGSVKANQKISALEGNFTGELFAGSFFGYGVAGVGDYDGDNIPDIAVSAPSGDIPVLYILHLNNDGTVKSMVTNTFVMAFGLSTIGDLNNDGKIDLVAANPGHRDGGVIHLVFLNDNSEVEYNDIVTIGENFGGFGEGLNANDDFGGRESALLGDLDGNGTLELAVGAFQSEGGIGAIWILSLDTETHQVVDKVKIAPGLSGFNESIPLDQNQNGTSGGHFGHAMAATGDLNGDGIPDLITGANQYSDGVGYILYLNADKTVKTYTRINNEEGGFDLLLEDGERFSRSISFLGAQSEGGNIKVNMGGGADGTGGLYALEFMPCTITSQGANSFWSGGSTLFTNWDHDSQTVSGALSQEQCQTKAFENDATHITTKESDGRCIVKDDNAILAESDEGSTAHILAC